MRSTLAAILLFFAITSQLGGYAIYMIQQHCLKEDMARIIASRLPENKLVKIQDSKNLDWEEEGKEFYVGNQFYDVVRSEKINGITWFYCINDTMQTNLYHDFAKTYKTNNENSGTSKSSKYNIKFSTTYCTIQELSSLTIESNFKLPHRVSSIGIATSFASDILIPPPNLI